MKEHAKLCEAQVVMRNFVMRTGEEFMTLALIYTTIYEIAHDTLYNHSFTKGSPIILTLSGQSYSETRL